MNWIDIIILVIIAYSAFRGLVTGFIKSVTGLLSLLISLLVAYKYHNVLTDYLVASWHLDERIVPLINPILSFLLPTNAYDTTSVTVEQAEQHSGIISPLILKILQGHSFGGEKTIGEIFSLTLAQGLLNIISFLILLLITNILINLVGDIINKIFDWGVLAPINRVGGAVFGIVRGMLIVFILLAVIMPLQIPVALLGGDTTITKALENSHVAAYFWQVLTMSDWSPAGNWLKPSLLETYFNSI
ncbi:MAG: CvpA family protein [Firmicutes bacterium]|nr:CvpA family protein [Bacillota bacterium]